jgi:molybdenum cofactor cytidylyltransferase
MAGIVLAAGPSVRIGFPRALLDFRGAPFGGRVLEALEALDLKVRVVVLGPDADRVRPVLVDHDCLVVENRALEGGVTGSLRAGLAALHALRPAAALVWPVDRPHVRIATVERLLEAQRVGAAAVVPRFGDRRGHPTVWGRGLLERLESGADGNAEQVLASPDAGVLELAVDDPAVVTAIDDVEDYERWIRQSDGGAA